MVKVAVILSGCGFLDGAEIRESVISLVALDKANADVEIFAPDIDQMHVINHLTGDETDETRNVLVESARIARGEVKDLKEANAADFDALILPGGYGVAKNLSDMAVKGADLTVLPEFKNLILDFIKQEKPIGAICISPAVLVGAVRDEVKPYVTIGDDADGLIESLGGVHQECRTRGMVIDDANNIVSCSAYMRDDRLGDVAVGIEKLVEAIINKASNKQEAA